MVDHVPRPTDDLQHAARDGGLEALRPAFEDDLRFMIYAARSLIDYASIAVETIMASDEERATALIRDHVVPLVEAKGQARTVGPTSQMMWETGPFRFALRTALSPTPLLADSPAYSEAQAVNEASRMLPYGLEVWHHDKVLSLEWDVDKLAVISFQRGPWEDEVLAIR